MRGFDVMNPPHFRHVVGRDGRSIREVWDGSGVRAYLGTVIPGFPNRDIMDRFDEEIQRRLAPTVWNGGGCCSWYVGADGRNFTTWPGFANEYKRRLARFDPAEFELTSTRAAPITA